MTGQNPQPVGANGRVVQDSDWGNSVDKIMTFAGGTTNDPGDHDGTGDPATLFSVSGTVLLRLLAVCETSIVGAGTIEVGITGDTASIIAQIADAEDLDVGEIWHDATPDKKVELSSVLVENVLANGSDVIQTVGTANLTAGAIRYTAIWYPLSASASVVAA